MTKIGLLDSGVGGLSVLKSLWRALRGVDFVYYADTQNMPYGSKTPDEIKCLVSSVCSLLLQQGCTIIVMACNTASALALDTVRQSFEVPVMGIITPAALAAAKASCNGRVGVVATVGTTRSKAYEKALWEVNPSLKVYGEACPWLASLIERGLSEHRDIVEQLGHCLNPLIQKGIDTLVLGCTHYALLMDLLPDLLPEQVTVIDPAQALTAEIEILNLVTRGDSQNTVSFFVSGSAADFSRAATPIIGYQPQVHTLR